jgi:hypothetical protein
MIDALAQALFGPLGGIFAGIGAILAAWFFGRYKGGSDARAKRAAKDAKEYRDERQKIDTEISGIGGTDSERIERLRDIARGRGQSPD